MLFTMARHNLWPQKVWDGLLSGEVITTLVEVEEAAWPEDTSKLMLFHTLWAKRFQDKEGHELDTVDYAKKLLD